MFQVDVTRSINMHQMCTHGVLSSGPLSSAQDDGLCFSQFPLIPTVKYDDLCPLLMHFTLMAPGPGHPLPNQT